MIILEKITFLLLFFSFYVKITLIEIIRKGVKSMITVSINANPDIEKKINNYVKENNINLNQVMLDLILEKIEDEEDCTNWLLRLMKKKKTTEKTGLATKI
jgi:hypothetical protein